MPGTFDFKAIAIVAILVFITIVGGAYWYRGKQIDTLKKEAIVDKISNHSLETTIKTNAGIAVVNTNVNADLANNKKVVNDTHDEITKKRDKKIQVINDTFGKEKEPLTPYAELKKQEMISSALINSIWSEYCTINTTHPVCITLK
jgi:hypothetical protein